MIRELLRRKRKAAAVEDVSDHLTIAPVTSHTLDPVTSPEDVHRLAGGDARFHDSMEGVDAMVMGDVDAMSELQVESNTPGSPMQLGPEESIFDGQGRHDELGDEEDPGKFDWGAWL